MKRNLLFIVLLLASSALFSFRMINQKDNNKPMKESYETLWKTFDEHMKNSLPESAEKVLVEIEQKAEKDKDQVQLLKVILYRRKVMYETVEENPEEAYLQYALAQLNRLETAEQALLHEEIAALYANYLDDNEYTIQDNLAIDGSLDGVAMKYWDRHTFENLIAQHYGEALKPMKDLQKKATKDYLCLYESPDDDYIEYEPTLFDFIFHRVAKYYREKADVDDLLPEWDTQVWWLEDKDFVKADLGDSDKPIIQCLKLFQSLIAGNKGDVRLYNDYKRYEFVNGIASDHDNYQRAIRSLMKNNKKSKQYPELANCLALDLIQQYQSNTNDSTYLDNYQKAAEICRETLKDYPESKACKETLDFLTHPHFEFSLNKIQLPNENIPVVVEYRNIEHPYYKIVKVRQDELDRLYRLQDKDFYEEMDKRPAVVEQTLNLTAETDYLTHSTLIALPPLQEGLYYIIGKNDAKGKIIPSQMFNIRIEVSRLGYIIDSKPNLFTLVTIDRKTGHPQEGVTVEITRRKYNYQKREYETERVATLKSDHDGRVVLTDKIGHDNFDITLRKGNDVLIPQNQERVASQGSSGKPYEHGGLVHY